MERANGERYPLVCLDTPFGRDNQSGTSMGSTSSPQAGSVQARTRLIVQENPLPSPPQIRHADFSWLPEF